ncbi:DUF3289 family protein [Pantoea ananatis]
MPGTKTGLFTQRWEKFAFKPFFTNMKAEFEISSRRNG